MTDEENTTEEVPPPRWGERARNPQPSQDEAAQFPAPPPARPVEQPPVAPADQPTQISSAGVPPVQPPAAPVAPPVVPSAEVPPVQPPAAPVTPPVVPSAEVPPVAPAVPPTQLPPMQVPSAEVPPAQMPPTQMSPSTPLGQNIGATPPVLSSTGEATVMSSSTAAPVLAGEYGVSEPPAAPDAPRSSSKLPWIVAVAGALFLLVGGGFFALNAFGASGGGETPEQAVDAMIEALNNEDFITMGELIEPSERRTIIEPTLTEVLPELERIGVFSDELDAGDVDGVDLELTDVTYRVEAIDDNPDMVHVYFTGGEAISEFTAADFPFSDRFRDEFSDELEDDRTVESIEDNGTPVTFVERDGRWYFSGWFTIAEAARLETDTRLPLASESPAALGAETPEQAVEGMVAAMVDLNLADMIGHMDPEEMAALYRYSPLFLEEGQDGLDEARQFLIDENISYDITNLDLEASTSGDDATVNVRGFTVNVSMPDFSMDLTYGRDVVTGQFDVGDAGRGSFELTTTSMTFEAVVDGESVSGELTFDPDAGILSGSGEGAGDTVNGELTFDPEGTCSRYTITVSGETETGCVEDEVDEGQEGIVEFYDTLSNDWPDEFPGFDVQARKTDGEWYVSPIGTTFAAYLSLFNYIEDDSFDEWVDSAGLIDPMSGFEDAMDELGVDSLDGSDELTFVDEVEIEDDFVTDSIGAQAQDITIMSLDPGASANLSGSLSGGYNVVTFDLEAGDTLVATVQAGPASDLDTTLTLVFNGAEVAYNDDASFDAELASSLDSQFETTVAESGTYELRVGSFTNDDTGEYNLELVRR